MRSYTDRTLKLLWGRAAGRCAVPSCRTQLLVDATDYDPIVVIGDIAHIEASSDKGPRGNPELTRTARNDYDNLILLCKNCHTRFDGQKNSNSVAEMQDLKKQHELWVRESLPERGASTTGWLPVILEGQHAIDAGGIHAALSPDFPLEAGGIRIGINQPDESWASVFARMKESVAPTLLGTDSFELRLAVFPLAPVTACFALGYLLTNRPRCRLFQYHRNEQTWRWPNVPEHSPEITVNTSEFKNGSQDIAFAFELSARVQDSDLEETGVRFSRVVRISVSEPSTSWLNSDNKVKAVALMARNLFEAHSSSAAGGPHNLGGWPTQPIDN